MRSAPRKDQKATSIETRNLTFQFEKYLKEKLDVDNVRWRVLSTAQHHEFRQQLRVMFFSSSSFFEKVVELEFSEKKGKKRKKKKTTTTRVIPSCLHFLIDKDNDTRFILIDCMAPQVGKKRVVRDWNGKRAIVQWIALAVWSRTVCSFTSFFHSLRPNVIYLFFVLFRCWWIWLRTLDNRLSCLFVPIHAFLKSRHCPFARIHLRR